MLPYWAWIVVAGVLGLMVGSFLNVVMLRLPERMAFAWRNEAREILELEAVDETAPPDLVRQPSHCPQCKHRLSARDNIPLFGWLLLGGRCRYCKARISIQYPLVELLTALLSAAIVWRFGPGWVGLAGLVFTWILVAASGIDFRTQLLPDQLTYPLLWLGLLLSLLPMFVLPHTAILAAAIGYLSLWSLYWLFKLLTGKEGMGYGDFKLLAALGAWMGPMALLPIMLLSSLIGAIVGVSLIALRKHERDVPMPFGPFIAAAGWTWFVFGPWLMHAYAVFFGLR
ncbi:methyltransferase [Oleiagrimonas soli]|uniref:Prepilin leader peptidase/N-methyltransferase n=1 Tax=Oleiagrimonas soli TaxID=1543381 RepID=A0A099CU31_9GAMM|nr:methyltransferase [Oleiagrimonas soli]